MGIHGSASTDRMAGLAAAAYDWGFALCAAALADVGRRGHDHADWPVGPQAGRRPLGDVSSCAGFAGCANLPDVLASVYDECLRSAPVDADCMASRRSCANRQRKKLALDWSCDRRYTAQQIRRSVFPGWPSCGRDLFAGAAQPGTAMVLDRRFRCHIDRAAEFSLATALELSFCPTGAERAGKWPRCHAAAASIPGAAVGDDGICLIASGDIGSLVSDFSRGPALCSACRRLLKCSGVHAPAQGQVLLRGAGLSGDLCARRALL